MSTNPDPEAIGAQLESLLQEMGALSDPAVSARAQELVRLLMSLYGAGLSRMLDVVRTEGGGTQAVLDRFAGDGLIASLLVLHDLHPHAVETRVRRALEGLQPHLPPAMTLTLMDVEEDTVRLRVTSAPETQGGAANLRASVERAIQEAAPEIASVRIDGIDGGGLIQITRRPAVPEASGAQ